MPGWGTTDNAPVNRAIDCGAFFPAIDTTPFYDEYRIPVELPAAAVLGHLRQAIIRVMRDLADWLALQEAATLAEVNPDDTVDGENAAELLWQRAVYCLAKAEILRETQTIDRRADAENTAKSGEDTEDKYREFSADAVALIMQENSIVVTIL